VHTLPSPDAWEDIARQAVLTLTRQYLTGDRAGLFCRVWEVTDGSQRLREHRFLPVSTCRYCGAGVDDIPIQVRLVARRMADPASLRVRSAAELRYLRAETVDARYGIILRLSTAQPEGWPAMAVPAARQWRGLAGIGRDDDPETAKTVAVLETLERLAGFPAHRQPAAYGSYDELSGQRLDPATVAQHQPEAINRPDAAVRAFDPGTKLSWTWAYSFSRGPLLVPEQLAYHLLPDRSREELCWQETSSGCAIGTCLEEAILHGLLEVIERDAFLGCWYLQRQPRSLVLPDSGPWQPHLERLSAAGYQCEVFDITWDISVPVVWALARQRPDHTAGPDGHQGQAWSMSGTCAHPDPNRAICGALQEVASQLGLRDFAARPATELAAMLADPCQVRSPADHRHSHAVPAAAPRFAFLAGAPRLPVTAAYPDWRRLIDTDLAQCLRTLISLVATHRLEVIAVDQTTGDQRRLGLRTAKVIVPGTLPMTFGHASRRTHAVPRLSARRPATPVPELPHCLS
jgi:thiazole/oxazole-forming peptide maturase SagD family component